MHVKASPEVIRARMASDPHEHPIVPSEDVEEVLGLFAAEYGLSWVKHKVEIDTSEMQPEDILEAFFDVVRPQLLVFQPSSGVHWLVESDVSAGLWGSCGSWLRALVA